jgi:hypothetical protein
VLSAPQDLGRDVDAGPVATVVKAHAVAVAISTDS